MKRFRLMALEFHQAYSLILLLNQHQFAYSVISIIKSNEHSDARQLSGETRRKRQHSHAAKL